MSGQNPVMLSASQIAAAARAAFKEKGLPPVQAWDPEVSGEIDILIDREGLWYHEGALISRPELVRLFSTILRKDDDDYFLVTPAEKRRIRVDDVPFVVVDMQVEGAGKTKRLTFITNLGDKVRLTSDAALCLRETSSGQTPYVTVRDRLKARIDRKTFYRMVDLGVLELLNGEHWFGLWSCGSFSPLAPASSIT